MIFAEPDPKFEAPVDKLDSDSLANWNCIPVEKREACIAVLRNKTPSEMFAIWKEQYKKGVRIGSDDPWFHLGIGMQIRNALRSVLTDNELPFIDYPDGEKYQNWDDFYGGALQQLVSEPEDILFSPVERLS